MNMYFFHSLDYFYVYNYIYLNILWYNDTLFFIGLIFTSQQCFSQSALSRYPFSHRQSELFLLALYHFSTAKWHKSWWHNEMKILSTLQALCEGNPSVIGGFPLQRASNVELLIFFMSAQTSCSTNIHPTSYLRWSRSCDISVMNSWNNTLQRKKDEVLCFRPLLYLLKWTRALPETKKCMCETHSYLGPEISSHYLVDGSLELYLRTRANAFLQWK